VIKLIRCLKRRAELPIEEFREFWKDPEYEQLIGNFSTIADATSCTRSLTLQIDINKELAELHGTPEAFDGIVEVTWPNAKKLLALRETDSGLKAVDDLLAFEDQFIDRSASRYFFTE